jgi:peptidoglycan/LPS O-acetylase OafA/YrhL
MHNPPPSTASGREHLPRLDAIRGIAIIMVVLFHAFMFDPVNSGQKVFSSFVMGLSQGVLLFFVLSGFLISLIVFENPVKFRLPTYLVRRIAKIIPPFLLSLIFYAVKDYHGRSLLQGFQFAAADLATLPNFLFKWKMINPVAWSLLVEIHFYLLLPLVFFGWRRLIPQQAERLTILCFLLIPPLFRAASWLHPAASPGERFFLVNRFPSAMDFFGLGMIFCHLYRNYRQTGWLKRAAGCLPRHGLLLLPLFLALYTALPFIFNENLVLDKCGSYEIARLFICLLTFCMLFCIWPQEKPAGLAGKIFDNRLLQYTGLISYEWFLFHFAILSSARFHLGKWLGLNYSIQSPGGSISLGGFASFTVLNAIAIAISFGLCAAIYHFYSQPLLKRIRDSVKPARPVARILTQPP